MVVWSCPALPLWIPEGISPIKLRKMDKQLNYNFKMPACAHQVMSDNQLQYVASPSSCRASPWSELHSCRVATFSMVSSITSFKSVSSSFQENGRQREMFKWLEWNTGKCTAKTVLVLHWIFGLKSIITLKCKGLIHLSTWLQSPKCYFVGTRWEWPKCSRKISQSVRQSAVNIDVEARWAAL